MPELTSARCTVRLGLGSAQVCLGSAAAGFCIAAASVASGNARLPSDSVATSQRRRMGTAYVYLVARDQAAHLTAEGVVVHCTCRAGVRMLAYVRVGPPGAIACLPA